MIISHYKYYTIKLKDYTTIYIRIIISHGKKSVTHQWKDKIRES